jgi:hypothetical protein
MTAYYQLSRAWLHVQTERVNSCHHHFDFQLGCVLEQRIPFEKQVALVIVIC